MPHLPCTNDDTRDEPECIGGHDWPEPGAAVRVKGGSEHRIVASELLVKFPTYVDTDTVNVTVETYDTDIHCVMAYHPQYTNLRFWVDLDDLV